MTLAVSASPLHTISPSTLHELTRAAAYKDAPTTNRLLNDLFGIQDPVNYGPLEQLRGEYDALSGAIAVYQPILSPEHTPVLHRAAFTGALESIKKIKSPALVNSKDLKGLTPLHYAIFAKQKEIVRDLIEKTDLTYLTPNQNSYLHYAAMTGDREILDLFLAKIDKSKLNNENLSAAHLWANSSNDLDGLKQCASPTIPLHAADQRELSPIGILLLKSASNYREPLTQNDLYLAAANLATLAVAGLTAYYFPLHTEDDATKINVLHLFHEIGIVAKRALVNEMIPNDFLVPKDSLSLERSLQARVGDFMLGGRVLNTLSAAGTAAVVSNNAFSALTDSKSATWGRTLLSLPVHALNVTCSVLDTFLAADPTLAFKQPLPPNEPEQKPTTPPPPPKCQNVSPEKFEEYKKMDIFTRMTDPVLSEHLHTKDSIKCLDNYKILIDPKLAESEKNDSYYTQISKWLFSTPEMCDKTLLKKLRLKLHPDKNPGNPNADLAMKNFNTAIEILCPKKA